MINVVFFAQIRETLGTNGLQMGAEHIQTVQDIVNQLATQFADWELVVSDSPCLCAVNQTLVDFSHKVNDGDEVAFFPPVTGG